MPIFLFYDRQAEFFSISFVSTLFEKDSVQHCSCVELKKWAVEYFSYSLCFSRSWNIYLVGEVEAGLRDAAVLLLGKQRVGGVCVCSQHFPAVVCQTETAVRRTAMRRWWGQRGRREGGKKGDRGGAEQGGGLGAQETDVLNRDGSWLLPDSWRHVSSADPNSWCVSHRMVSAVVFIFTPRWISSFVWCSSSCLETFSLSSISAKADFSLGSSTHRYYYTVHCTVLVLVCLPSQSHVSSSCRHGHDELLMAKWSNRMMKIGYFERGWLLVSDRLVWVFQTLLIYWGFHREPSLGLI